MDKTFALQSKVDLTVGVYYDLATQHDLRHLLSYHHAGNTINKEGVYATWGSRVDDASQYCVWFDETNPDVIGMINCSNGMLYFSVAGVTPELAQAEMDRLITLAPEEPVPDDNTITVNFWSQSSNGPINRRRRIEVPTWDDISLNYNDVTMTDLDSMLTEDFRPTRGGQLVLWHGPPGTGKTTALRALGREWKNWAELHFITDPERFFGSDSDYMLNVMIDQSTSDDKWRVLVLEDCGELLAKDARVRLANSQALSRFLNAVDGILGQGLKLLVLVTTNENLGKLHEAVTRPGRCLSEIEFAQLEAEKVRQWAEMNQIDAPVKVASLAELFAIKENFTHKESSTTKQTVGFGV